MLSFLAILKFSDFLKPDFHRLIVGKMDTKSLEIGFISSTTSNCPFFCMPYETEFYILNFWIWMFIFSSFVILFTYLESKALLERPRLVWRDSLDLSNDKRFKAIIDLWSFFFFSFIYFSTKVFSMNNNHLAKITLFAK